MIAPQISTRGHYFMSCRSVLITVMCQFLISVAAHAEGVSIEQVRAAVDAALPLLERASAGSANERTCFTCHSQAMPVLTLAEAKRRGFETDRENFQRQVEHTHSHLQRGRKSYAEGKGQGGGVDTAGYALWTLEDGKRESDEVTEMVTDWLLQKQHQDGYWKRSSNRPPSEASNFTTTYLALRALNAFANQEKQAQLDQAYESASQWLHDTKPKDTEERVFRLLSLRYIDSSQEVAKSAVETLKSQQKEDGGWSQLDEMSSDAYATGTVLYALALAGVPSDDDSWQSGVRFLLQNQQEDGSWHVVSRSEPFQKYFETGFPHGKDQFISTSGSGWATIALLMTLPKVESDD